MVELYGSSVVMSGIETSLKEKRQFRLKRLERLSPPRRGASDSDVILFDLATAPADHALSLLQARPMHMMLTLIGVDIENKRMLVLSGGQCRLLTVEDLVHAIEGGFPHR